MFANVQSKATEKRTRSSPVAFLKKGVRALPERIRHMIIQTAPNCVVRRKKELQPITLEEFSALPGIQVRRFSLGTEEHQAFLRSFYPNWREDFAHAYYKKLVELHGTWRLLQISENDTYLDLAGGLYTYAGRLKAGRQLLNDRYVNPVLRARLVTHGVELVESPAERLPMPDESVDKISCHHSFEHFRGDTDKAAILEIQRVLRPGGKACIIPLFVARGYFEIVDVPWTPRSDSQARRVFDPTSPFPGGRFSGDFARVYDLHAFQSRVLNSIDSGKFSVSIVQLENGSTSLPDSDLPCHRTDPPMDFPYRALLFERRL